MLAAEVSLLVFFFFKQKTAYEMLRSLVGSEMCIRDSHGLLGYLILYREQAIYSSLP